MSILAQIRLTLLSQKCCHSMASWRYDIHAGLNCSNQQHAPRQENQQNIIQPGISMEQSLILAETQAIHNHAFLEANQNHKRCFRIDETILDFYKAQNHASSTYTSNYSNLRKSFIAKSYNFFTQYKPLDGKIAQTQHGNCNHESTFDGLKQPTSDSIAENNWYSHQYSNLLLFSIKLRNALMSYYSRIQRQRFERSYNRSRYSNQNGPNWRDSNFVPLSMLAFTGFFNKMSSDDAELERQKLSDEQKLKKMKPFEILIAKGVLSMCDQEFNKANELFHDALNLIQQQQQQQQQMQQQQDGKQQEASDYDTTLDDQEILILNLLASNYFEGGDFENAEKLFVHLMKKFIANGMEPTDPAVLELSLKLASIYGRNKSTHDRATKGFKFVINSLLFRLEELLGKVKVEDLDLNQLSEDKKNELALLGWSYDWFAKHLLSINDFDGAAIMLKKALEISAKVLGSLHDQTLILLNDVGTTMAMNNEPEEGRAYLQQAVEGAIESQSSELASFYVNLGLVNLKLKQYSEAKRYCEYSIELATKNGEHHNSSEVIKLSRHCLQELEGLLQFENH